MHKATKNFKSKVTSSCNKAAEHLDQAMVLLALGDNDISTRNLDNKKRDLVEDKTTLESFEAEMDEMLNGDQELSPDERQLLRDEISRTMVQNGHINKIVQIADVIDQIESRVDQVEERLRGCNAGAVLSAGTDGIDNNADPRGQRPRSPSPNGFAWDNEDRASIQEEDGNAALINPEMIQQEPRRKANPNHGGLPRATIEQRLEDMERVQTGLWEVINANNLKENQRHDLLQQDIRGMTDTICRLMTLVEGQATGRTGIYETQNVQPQRASTRVNAYPSNNPVSFNTNNSPLENPLRTQQNPTAFNNQARPFVPQHQQMEDLLNMPPGELERLVMRESMKASIVTSVLTAVKPFSGEAHDFPSFMALFDSMCHNNKLLDTATKQTMLVSLLPPDLAREHQTIEVSEENYKMIRTNLDRQFNRKKTQMNIMLRQLKETVFPANDDKKLVSALNTYATIASKLQAFGVNPNDPYFISELIAKLPPRILLATHKEVQLGKPTLNDIMNVAHDTIALYQGIPGRNAQQALGYDEAYANSVHVNQLNGTNSGGRQEQPLVQNNCKGKRIYTPPAKALPCAYCRNNSHCAAECRIPLDKKMEALRKYQLCGNCLSDKHLALECQSKMNCFHCHLRHFTGHCSNSEVQAKAQINNMDAIDRFDLDCDNEEAQRQLFQESGAETPEF